MKIAIFSDVHLEWLKPRMVDRMIANIADRCRDADIVINAGDTGGPKLRKALAAKIERPYIDVLGNHDFYGDIIIKRAQNADPNIPDWSSDAGPLWETIEIGGVKIWAGTLWSDLSNPVDAFFAQTNINDFRLIRTTDDDGSWKLTPEDVTTMHRNSLASIAAFKPDVVASHFPPLRLSNNPKYPENELTPYFCNDLSEFIFDNPQIKLWISGHTHNSCDYTFEGCRFVSNQRGYPGEIPDFDVKIVEI